MARLIKKERGNYTNTSNLIIRDDRLHWNSRGIFVYLWSQANEWQFYVKEIVKHSPGGETELRTALKELEKYGYLKRTPRHGQSGSFNGMDWILSDVGGLNRHAENPDDGSINENQPKEIDYPSSAKPVERETRRTDNRTLRNNNIKKYQYKEITTNKSSSLSIDDKPVKIQDPFTEQQDDDDEKVVEGLINLFLSEARIARPAPYEYRHIKNSLLAMGQSNATEFMYRVINKVSTSSISDPVAYLERSLINAGGEANG